jgi:hypothetical protein
MIGRFAVTSSRMLAVGAPPGKSAIDQPPPVTQPSVLPRYRRRVSSASSSPSARLRSQARDSCPPKVVCTWASTKPGVSRRPVAVMVRAAGVSAAPVPISLMSPSRMLTRILGPERVPVEDGDIEDIEIHCCLPTALSKLGRGAVAAFRLGSSAASGGGASRSQGPVREDDPKVCPESLFSTLAEDRR